VPIIIDKVVSPTGKDLGGQPQSCSQALTPEVAAGVANAMIGSTTGGTSSPGNPRDGVPIAGKTGTSPVADHLWIIESTTRVGTAVWTGNIQGHQSLRRIKNPNTGAYYASSSRFTVIKTLMAAFNADPTYRGGAFPAASAAMLGGQSSTVPSVIGQTPEQAKALLESLNYVYAEGTPVPSALPAGKVASTDPAPGTKTPIGSTVTVYTSDGSLATTMPEVTGKSRHDATQLIAAKGFDSSKIQVVWVASTTSAGPMAGPDRCTVVGSDPAGNAAASKADPITLKVSTGLPASDPQSNQPASGPGCNP
jgi:membrane peptidoglycan carboxypeptidase